MLLVAGATAGTLVGLFAHKSSGIDLHARLPENGGWSMETIHAQVGEPIHLRLTSDDVVHGFAIGKSGQPAVDILPGEWIETTLVFDQPGTYTFYCTRWCSRDHWRMRGVIEVSGPGAAASPQPQPLYLQLGLDLDAPHPASALPSVLPSAGHGASLAASLPAWTGEQDVYLSSSPAEFWQRLRSEPSLADLSDMDLWDATAWIWQSQASPENLQQGAEIYSANCAACHGESGKGDGVMVRGLPAMDHTRMGSQLVHPPDFSDPQVLLGASPALLQGKIIRGGMGTGMPYWGPILTSEEIDAVVAYLYHFAWQGQSNLNSP